MPEFRYQGLNASGKVVRGALSATDKKEAKRRIGEMLGMPESTAGIKQLGAELSERGLLEDVKCSLKLPPSSLVLFDKEREVIFQAP